MHNTLVDSRQQERRGNASLGMTSIFTQRIDIALKIFENISDVELRARVHFGRRLRGVGRVTVAPRRPPEGGREGRSRTRYLASKRDNPTGRNFSAGERARPLFHGYPDGTHLLCPIGEVRHGTWATTTGKTLQKKVLGVFSIWSL